MINLKLKERKKKSFGRFVEDISLLGSFDC